MSTFLRHVECPACGSKDNRGLWDDGHEYCFGCHDATTLKWEYTNRGTTIISQPPLSIDLPRDATKNLPANCILYLDKYTLSREEIASLNVCWSESCGLLIFPFYKDSTLLGYNARRMKGDGHKYIVRGNKSAFSIVMGKGEPLVFTEDLISAKIVSRTTSACALFGTSLPLTLLNQYVKMYLWLDKDKRDSAIIQCRKWQGYGYDISPILTDKDPKDYSEQEIIGHLT